MTDKDERSCNSRDSQESWYISRLLYRGSLRTATSAQTYVYVALTALYDSQSQVSGYWAVYDAYILRSNWHADADMITLEARRG